MGLWQSGTPIIKKNGSGSLVGIYLGKSEKRQKNIGIRLNTERKKIIYGWIQEGKAVSLNLMKFNKFPEGNKGKVHDVNGGRFFGGLKNGKRNGYGICYYFAEDYVYKGSWENDLKNGQGTLIYSNGSYFEGNFKDDLRNGYGIQYYTNEDIYKGNWR